MKKFNVGMIGYGWAAGAHIAAINGTKLGQVTKVFSSRKLDDAEVSAKHGCPIKTYNSLAKMLSEPDLDVVDICSYPQNHAKHAIASAQAGKHIIVEKPLALNWKDCQTISQAVKKAKVQVCVCFECRYSSQFLTTKAVVDKGLLGKLHYGEVDYYHGIGPWYGQYRWNTTKKAGGSSLLSAGCHAMDGLLLCMGSEVDSVTSYSTRSANKDFVKYEYPTSSVTILKFKDGKVGKVASVIDCIQPYYFHVHLVGSEGSLLDNKIHSAKLGALDKSKWSSLSAKMLDSGDVADHPYLTQFDAFFNALDAGKPMALTNLDNALKTHRVIAAADESARTGKPVRIGT